MSSRRTLRRAISGLLKQTSTNAPAVVVAGTATTPRVERNSGEPGTGTNRSDSRESNRNR